MNLDRLVACQGKLVTTGADTLPTSPSQSRRWPLLLVGAIACAAGVSFAFGWASEHSKSEPPPPAPAPAAADTPTMSDGVFTFTEDYAKRAGIRVDTAIERDLAPITEVTGQVDFSPEDVAAVGTRIFGHVDEVDVLPGQHVEAGQPLARLVSSALGEAQARLSTADAREHFAEVDRKRKERLVAEGIAADRSAQVALRELEAARAQRRAAEQSIRAMGGVPSNRTLGNFVLRAPITGEVVEMNVFRGQAVQPDHQAFKIADLSQLWLELAVYERDLPRLQVGDEVLVHPSGDELTVVKGVVAHVGSLIDPGTRTATVRVHVDNQERKLRIGQAVQARIISTGSQVHALAVPRTAVVLVDGEQTVFVSPRDGEAFPRRVRVGVRSNDYLQITEGLEPGERIVVDGVFELKSELFR